MGDATSHAIAELALTALPYAVAIIGTLLATLCSVLAWVGLSMNRRLTELTREVSATNLTLSKIERDLRGELSRLDRRVTRVEARCDVQHGPTGDDIGRDRDRED